MIRRYSKIVLSCLNLPVVARVIADFAHAHGDGYTMKLALAGVLTFCFFIVLRALSFNLCEW